MKLPVLTPKHFETCFHNIKRLDEFSWVKADNWQEVLKNPETLPDEIRNYLEAENEYVDELLKPVKGLAKELLEEMKAQVPDEDKQVPVPDGDFLYWQEFSQGQEHPCFFYQQKNGKKTMLLNADETAKKHTFFRLGEVCHCDNHSYLGWSADISGGEFYDINIRDIKSGEDIDIIKNCDGSFVFVGSHIFYVVMDDKHRPVEVKCHQIGSSQTSDISIFKNPDPAFFLSIDKALACDYLFISTYDHDSSEVFILKTENIGTQPPILIKPRNSMVEYQLEFDRKNKRFFILTNQNAVDFKIMVADEKTPNVWQDYIGHKEGSYILSFVVFENHLVRLVRDNGLPKLIVRNLDDESEYEYSFSTEPHSLRFSTGFTYETKFLRVFYSSMRQPQQVFDFNLASKEKTLLKTQQIKSGHNENDFISKLIMADGADGVKIPISIFYHKDSPPKPTSPLWLYGYGAYGLTIEPSFSAPRTSLVKRGWCFAIAHIRGGAMKGRSWYLNGKLEHKPNSFSDFISCAKHLINSNQAAKGNIIAQGGSAGGMLMGAVANQAPELFKAIIAQVPFVDVLATMLDETLPLTPPEWLEWGNPIKDETAYRRIASYSPYDNVVRQNYPWILATSGLSDPRVGYWEATKWVARLRKAQLGRNPIALKTEMSAGHAGKTGRFDALEEIAQIYGFAMLAIGP